MEEEPMLADRRLSRTPVAMAVSLVLAAAGCNIPPGTDSGSADLVLRGGAVYTVDAARSWAEAVAVRGNRIVYVGPEDGVSTYIGPRTRVVDLKGKMVLPGFQDAHIHAPSKRSLGSGGGMVAFRLHADRHSGQEAARHNFAGPAGLPGFE
jgi:hypothetical protein